MTCQFQEVPVVFNKSLVDLENCTSFLKTTCDLWNSTCEIDLLKLLALHNAAIKLIDHVSKEMESRKTPGNVYIDLSKAFDTLTFDI